MTGPYKRFRDIPQFVEWGGYAADVPWNHIERTLVNFSSGTTLELDPDFQRAHVWTERQQSAYVEFILRGGKSGRDILWNCPGWPSHRDGRSLVLVDGKQRLQAVRRFLGNEITAFGNFCASYSDHMPMTGPSFRFHVNGLKTRAEVLQWYLDLNRGGTIHTDDEIEKVRSLLAAEQGVGNE
jgi:uncharacterized protein DUF262